MYILFLFLLQDVVVEDGGAGLELRTICCMYASLIRNIVILELVIRHTIGEWVTYDINVGVGKLLL